MSGSAITTIINVLGVNSLINKAKLEFLTSVEVN